MAYPTTFAYRGNAILADIPSAEQISTISAVHIRLLGDFQFVDGDTPLPILEVPRLQSLMAYLMLHRNAPPSRSQLATLLWPDSLETQAYTNLRGLLHRLRRVFPTIHSFLHTEKQEISWRPDCPWTLDVENFENAIAQAHRAEQVRDHIALCGALQQAVEVYSGDLLPHCYDDWILTERERLHQLFLDALERLIVLLEEQRNVHAAIAVAQRLLRSEPLHEAAYRHLMHLYAAIGDRAAALRVYSTCATVLEREMAVEPSPATRRAYEHLLHTEGLATVASPSSEARTRHIPLVGRQREWTAIQAVWHRVSQGFPQVLLLTGEAGIGKTRLAEELLTWVGKQGVAAVRTRCHTAEGRLAYAPIAAWLRAEPIWSSLSMLADVWLVEVARLVPELLTKHPKLPHPSPLDGSWQRRHLFEALARAILGSQQPLLLLLDDLQHCDRETLEWLHYLLRFDPQARLLLIGTVRPEEMVIDQPLKALLTALCRGGQVTEIALEPLNEGETVALAGHVADFPLDPAVLASFYPKTEGNPLFVVETVRMEVESALKRTYSAVEERPFAHLPLLPPVVQAVIAARLAQLSPSAQQLLGIAATIGRTFAVAVLAQASGYDEEALIQGLEELRRRRIIREQSVDAYEFSHGKLREAAYAALSSARRRLLQRRVVEALAVVVKASEIG